MKRYEGNGGKAPALALHHFRFLPVKEPQIPMDRRLGGLTMGLLDKDLLDELGIEARVSTSLGPAR
jgi:hypothetical protein